MGFVMAAFVTVTIVVVVVWLLSLQKSASADRTEAEARIRDAQEEAELRRKGAPLHCLGCGASFSGPMPDDGCPNCHVASLVVTEAKYQATRSQTNNT